MIDHDSSYKHIFSHAEIIADLLRGFVREDWVEQIDYATLERVSGSYVTDDLRDRADDIIWRVRVSDSWLYVYLLIEFQSRVDPWMALRILVYTGLLYQDLIRSRAVGSKDKLPPVFPIVIYNGKGRWTAARDVAELIEPFPGSLAKYRPSQRHFVLDEGRVGGSDCLPEHNTLSEIIRLELSPSPAAVRAIIANLVDALSDVRYDSLRRAMVLFINRVVLERLVPNEKIPEVTNLQELDAMLAERVVEWTEKWKQEGLQQGRQEGLQQGIREGMQQGIREGMQQGMRQGKLEGEAAVLERQLTRRFGPLSVEVRARISGATLEQLEHWADTILDAKSLDEVFVQH